MGAQASGCYGGSGASGDPGPWLVHPFVVAGRQITPEAAELLLDVSGVAGATAELKRERSRRPRPPVPPPNR